MQNTTTPQRCKAHYESEDFKNNYAQQLFEQFGNEEREIIDRILDKFNVSNYETQKELSNWKVLTREQAKKVYAFIAENFEAFTDDFSGYYVGYTSLESVTFGEQEEQMDTEEVKQEFITDGDFVINRDCAYYVVSGGLHVDLLKAKNLLNTFLNTI